jgi:hypothetical protein
MFGLMKNRWSARMVWMLGACALVSSHAENISHGMSDTMQQNCQTSAFIPDPEVKGLRCGAHDVSCARKFYKDPLAPSLCEFSRDRMADREDKF